MISLLLVLFFSGLFSQQDQFTIKGDIKSKDDNKIVIGAVVSLLNTKDSSIVTGVYSSIKDNKSVFTLKAKKNYYLLKFTHISFKEKYIYVNLNKDIDLGTIQLLQSDLKLEDIVVTGEKEYMELQLDKRVFNVSQDATNKGRNAADMLDNIPSVTVDAEGNVSLRGSENVRILVDGKQSGLVGRDPETLRMMMGDMIDKIEIITNPSARYDAEGQVGIINIVLKKEQRKGFNGNTEVNSGVPDNHGISVSSNYRSEKYNLFGSLGFGYRKFPGFADVEQYFFNDPDKYLTTTRRDQTRGGYNNTIRLGSDFFINEKNTITFSGMYRFGKRDNFAELVYRDFDRQNDLLLSTLRTDNEKEDSEMFEFSLNYDFDLGKEGHTLKAVINFFQDEDLELSNLNQGIIFNNSGVNDIVQNSSNLEFERNQLYQIDYVYPFAKDGKFEAGLKSTLRKIDNDFGLSQRNENGTFDEIEQFNNNFIYLEDIYAAYIMAGNKFSNFSYQFGLRSEYSDISTELTETNESNPRTYFNFFPSTHFSYKLNQANSIQLSYARRIQRPRFRFLMPISSFSDNRNFWFGNPDLDPEFSDSYETGHLYNWEKGSVMSSIYYRHSTNVIQRVTYLDEDGITIISPFNIGTQNDIGTELNFSYDPYKWLKFNTNFNLFHVSIIGNAFVGNLDAQSWTTNAKLNSKIKLFWDIDFSINYNYRGPMQIPQGRIREIWFVDFALSKDVIDNMTVTFTGSDVFSTRMRRLVTQDVNYYFDQDFQWRSGLFTVSLSYRINQDKSESKSNTPSIDE